MKRSAGILSTLALALYGCATTNAPAQDPREDRLQKLENSVNQLSDAITADRRGRFSSPQGVADVYSLSLTQEADALIYRLQNDAALTAQSRRTDGLSNDVTDVWTYSFFNELYLESRFQFEEHARTEEDTTLRSRAEQTDRTTADLTARVRTLETAPSPTAQTPPSRPTPPSGPQLTDEQKVLRGLMTLEDYNRNNR